MMDDKFHLIFLIIHILCYVFSSFLCMKTLHIFLTIKKNILLRILLFFGCNMLCTMIIYIGDLVNLPPTILFFLVTVIVSCDGNMLKKVTVSLMIASTAFAFNALYDNFFVTDYSLVTDYSFVSGYTFESRLVFWLILYMIIRHHAPPKNYELTDALWKLLLLITLTPLGIVLSVVLLQSPFKNTTIGTRLSNFFLLILAIFSFIGLLWMVTVLARQQKLEQERALSEMNQKYYENLEQHQYEVRKLKHDMANHLQILVSLPEDKKKDYLMELIQNPVINTTITFCPDPTINAVLNTKMSLMEQNHITFDKEIHITEPLNVANSDLCALLANALDNAIEACQKIPSTEQRVIHFEAKAQKGLFVVQMTNPVKEFIKTEQNIFRTTKKNQMEHGYGLRSIQEIVMRYGGSLEVNAKNNLFSLFLYIPIHE